MMLLSKHYPLLDEFRNGIFPRETRRRINIQTLPLIYAGNPVNATRDIGFLSFLSSYCVFDWIAEDGLNPFVPSGQTMIGAGTREDIDPAIHRDYEDDGYIIAKHTPGVLSLDVADLITYNGTDDVIIIHSGSGLQSDLSGQIFEFGLFHDTLLSESNPSFSISEQSGNVVFQVDGASTVTRTLSNYGYNISILVCDANGNLWGFVNGTKTATVSTPSLGTSTNLVPTIGINTASRETEHEFCYAAIGSGIADLMTDAKALQVTNSLRGMSPTNGPQPSYDRNCSSSKVINSKFYSFGKYAPSCGESDGLLIEPIITNKCYRNVNNQTTAGWNVVGPIVSTRIADDSTDLGSAGSVDCRDLGPSVIELNNPGAITGYAYNGAASGNTNKHSLQTRAKLVTGTGAQLGCYCTVGLNFSFGVSLNDNYAITKNPNITPQSTTAHLAIAIPAGEKVYVIGQQYEENIYCTEMIPNLATGSTAQRILNKIDTGVAINHDEMELEFDLKTVESSKTGTQIDNIIGCTGTVDHILFFNQFSGNKMKLSCNAATVDTTDDIYDGNWHHIKAGWSIRNSLMYIMNGSSIDTATYDGTIGSAPSGASGNVQISHSTIAHGYYIKNFKINSRASL